MNRSRIGGLTRPTINGKPIGRRSVAKKSVIEVVCERCERTEYVNPDEYSTLPDLVLQFGTKAHAPEIVEDGKKEAAILEHEASVRFEDLCSSCKNTVRNLVANIGKKINYKKRGKGEDGAEGVEVEVGVGS